MPRSEVRDDATAANWDGSFCTVQIGDVVYGGGGIVITRSTHSFEINNHRNVDDQFTFEYKHSIQEKAPGGTFREIENNTVPQQPDNGDFTVPGNGGSVTSAQLPGLKNKPGWHGNRTADFFRKPDHEYKLVCYTEMSPVHPRHYDNESIKIEDKVGIDPLPAHFSLATFCAIVILLF